MTDMMLHGDIWATFPTLADCWMGKLAMTIETGMVFECVERIMT